MNEPQETHEQDPYKHVRPINPELKTLDSIPLTGSCPPFPWEELAKRLTQAFEQEDLTIEASDCEWRSKEELLDGIGNRSFSLSFSIPTMRGEASLVVSEQDISLLTALLLHQESPPPMDAENHTLIESFYHFFALETLYHLHQLFDDKTIAPILNNATMAPDYDALCRDISLKWKNHLLRGRLILSPDLQRSWKEHFADNHEETALSSQLGQSVNTLLKVEAGKTNLSLKEWLTVQEGDFLILDHCSIDHQTFDGQVELSADGKQLFSAKLKNGNLKIVEP